MRVENIEALCDQLPELGPYFSRVGLKFYVSQGPIDLSKDSTTQLASNKENVLVETLLAGTLGLPQIPKPVLGGLTIPVLHPSVLILTKLKRWASNPELAGPKSVAKRAADATDIEFLIFWLAENDLKIGFDEYSGKTRDELVPLVRKYRDKFAFNDNLMVALKAVLGDDWDLLQTGCPSCLPAMTKSRVSIVAWFLDHNFYRF